MGGGAAKINTLYKRMMQRLGGQTLRVGGGGVARTGQELEQTEKHSDDNGIPHSEMGIKPRKNTAKIYVAIC